MRHQDMTVVFADAVRSPWTAKLPQATGEDSHFAMQPGNRRALEKILPAAVCRARPSRASCTQATHPTQQEIFKKNALPPGICNEGYRAIEASSTQKKNTLYSILGPRTFTAYQLSRLKSYAKNSCQNLSHPRRFASFTRLHGRETSNLRSRRRTFGCAPLFPRCTEIKRVKFDGSATVCED